MAVTATRAPTTAGWFEVDKDGLGSLRESVDPASLLYELAQNVWDEDGATYCRIELTRSSLGYYSLIVEDDVPGGFRDLKDAYRLFAPSYKRGIATKRGRFNLGEKLVLALCQAATITTTSGTVVFAADGTRTEDPERRRPAGTIIKALVKFTKKQAEQALEGFNQVIPPAHVTTTANGTLVPTRAPLRTIDVKGLPTVLTGPEGFRPTTRDTVLELYEPLAGEKATIYELGIPIVETGDRWHVNVTQKVPLNMDRDNVTPAYLRRIRAEVANASLEAIRLEPEIATATWTKEALADPRVSPEAVQTIVTARYGERAVAFDPSDVEGSKKAVSEGYTVVYPRMLGKEEWAQVREKAPELLRPAGQVTPSNSTIELGATGDKAYQPDAAMLKVAEYAKAVSAVLVGFEPAVTFTCEPTGGYSAAYGRATRSLIFNVGTLGKRWFSDPSQSAILSLLIHELAHVREGDHLSERYHKAVCDLGASATIVALEGWFPKM